MNPYSSPYIIPNNSSQYPFPHSLLSSRELITARPKSNLGIKKGLGFRVLGFRV